jgi:hypothetical protein
MSLHLSLLGPRPGGRTHFCFRPHSEKCSMRREHAATDTCARLKKGRHGIASMLEGEGSGTSANITI